MGHLFDFYAYIDTVLGGGLGAALWLCQVTAANFRFESLQFCQHQGLSIASLRLPSQSSSKSKEVSI